VSDPDPPTRYIGLQTGGQEDRT